ncbi:MAG TPA: hypothetical protein VFO29_06170 [Candidatus Rubrimentiphilum sp.]|nr:hypothetical protein [Candidatus Rubrimentiphilum sp.]
MKTLVLLIVCAIYGFAGGAGFANSADFLRAAAPFWSTLVAVPLLVAFEIFQTDVALRTTGIIIALLAAYAGYLHFSNSPQNLNYLGVALGSLLVNAIPIFVIALITWSIAAKVR